VTIFYLPLQNQRSRRHLTTQRPDHINRKKRHSKRASEVEIKRVLEYYYEMASLFGYVG